jgi:hypothetical protein
LTRRLEARRSPDPARRRLLGVALAASLSGGGLGAALAQPAPAATPAAASLQRTAEGLFLSGRVALAPSAVVEDALLKGVPLYFLWRADVVRDRWYWTDKRVARAARVVRVAYQPLTRRWRVSLSSDAAAAPGSAAGLQYALHQTHDSLADALAGVGRVVRWKIADAAALEPGATHRVELDFRLDLSLLPRPFQIGLANQPDWTVELSQRLPVPEAIEPEPALEAR